MSDVDVRYALEVQAAMERAAGELTKALADRDEWRALARELGASLQQAVDWREGHRPLDDLPVARIMLAKLREKGERDAGR